MLLCSTRMLKSTFVGAKFNKVVMEKNYLMLEQFDADVACRLTDRTRGFSVFCARSAGGGRGRGKPSGVRCHTVMER